MLHFVPRTAAAVAELRRVARPGGLAAAAVWDARGGLVAHRLFFDTAAVLDPAAEELRALQLCPADDPAGRACAPRGATPGSRRSRKRRLTIRMEFADFEDFWSPYLGGQGPGAAYVVGLDAAALDRLREHVRRAYLDGETDGPRSYAATAWAVRGVTPG